MNLATKLPGQKIQVLVSLLSVPKVMYSLWYDDDFWEAKEQRECPCDERPFRVRDTSLNCSPKYSRLGRKDPKGLNSLKAAEQFFDSDTFPGLQLLQRHFWWVEERAVAVFQSVGHLSAPACAPPRPGSPHL